MYKEAAKEEQDEKIVKSLLKQRQLAKESASEPLGKRLNQKHFAQCLYAEREILRAITFIHLAQTHLIHEANAVNTELKLFHESVNNAFTQLITLIKSKSTKLTPSFLSQRPIITKGNFCWRSNSTRQSSV